MSAIRDRAMFILLIALTVVGFPITYGMGLDTLKYDSSSYLIGIPFCLLYTAVVVLVFRFTPIWPKGTWWWIPIALVWGGFPASLFVKFAGASLTGLMRQLDLSIFTASLAGALPEEVGKALGVFLILAAFKQFTRPWHGLIVGVFVGLGFTLVENLGYGAVGGLFNPISDASGVMHMWTVRSQFGASLHSIFTGAIGWGIGLAMFTADRKTSWRIGKFLVWFAFGFGFHFVWNSSPQDIVVNLIKIIVASVIGYSTFIFLVVHSWRWAKQEKPVSAPPIAATDPA